MVINPAKINLVIYQGATFDKTYQWQDANRNPMDLTGFTARLQVRSRVDDDTILLGLNTEGTIDKRIVLGGTEGTYQLVLSAVNTSALDWGSGVYDMELISPTGVVRRIMEGVVKVHRNVTR